MHVISNARGARALLDHSDCRYTTRNGGLQFRVHGVFVFVTRLTQAYGDID